jgi:hypothetical protein
MIKRLVLLVLGAMVITLLVTTVAMAATPQDIYNDFADNGKLDGTYTQAELRAFLNDAYFKAYPPHNIDTLNQIVTEMLTERETFPFTGFQLMIAGIVAVVLVGGGLALRRFARSS